MRRRISLAFLAALVLIGAHAQAATDAEKCEAKKNKVAGKYFFCRLKADAKAALRGTLPDYGKCSQKFEEKWYLAENKVPGVCPDNVSTVSLTVLMDAYIASRAEEIAAVIAGAQAIPLLNCGDNTINGVGEECDGTDVGGEDCTTLGFSSGTLACDSGCAFDTTSCGPSVHIRGPVFPSGLAGGTIDIAFAISTDGLSVAGTEFDLTYPSSILTLSPGGCVLNPVISKNLTLDILTADTIRATVAGGSQPLEPIGDGPMFLCSFDIVPATLPGTYPITVSNAFAQGDLGSLLPVQGVDGGFIVTLIGPTPAAIP